MDGYSLLSSPIDLYARLGTAAAPLVIDVRPAEAFDSADRLIVAAIRRPPDAVEKWRRGLPANRPVVVYCEHGHEVSQRVATALRAGRIRATYLDGGLQAWQEHHLPTRRKRETSDAVWVTRERPKIDRIACPWLVSRFINPHADFRYVPATEVVRVARETGGIPYDVKDVEFGHVGERCSFDAIVAAYDIHDAALDRLAIIVRGADTSRPDLTPQCEGLLAISYGLSANFSDDHEMLSHGLVMYDALYTWCRMQPAEQV